jgi:hypothetical protein
MISTPHPQTARTALTHRNRSTRTVFLTRPCHNPVQRGRVDILQHPPNRALTRTPKPPPEIAPLGTQLPQQRLWNIHHLVAYLPETRRTR